MSQQSLRSYTSDNFFIRMNSNIKLVAAYMEKKYLETIFTICRLRPHDLFLTKDFSTQLHRHWIDEFGNSFKIIKKKEIKIIKNDLTIDKRVLSYQSSDLYSGLNLEKISLISNLAYIFQGKEQDSNEDHFIIALLGFDKRLRVFSYIYGEWKNISPLYLGMKILKLIATNLDLKSYKEIKNKDQIILPCDIQKSWIISWPPNKDFLQEDIKLNIKELIKE